MFIYWTGEKQNQMTQYRTRPAATIHAIQNTDFATHSSRCPLVRIVLEAGSLFRCDDEHLIPLGSRNGHRFGLRPLTDLEKAMEAPFPYPAWEQDDCLQICYHTFGVSAHTYSQLWCVPPETGLPQTCYGHCSGNGLLGLPLSPHSFRQLSPSSNPSPQILAGGGSNSLPANSDTASPRRTVSGGSGSSTDTSDTASPQSTVDGRSIGTAATSLPDADSYAPTNHAFVPLGRIYVETTFDDDKRPQWQRWAETAHIVAVDTSDQSVWMLYQAWFGDEEQWEVDPENYIDPYYEYPSMDGSGLNTSLSGHAWRVTIVVEG